MIEEMTNVIYYRICPIYSARFASEARRANPIKRKNKAEATAPFLLAKSGAE